MSGLVRLPSGDILITNSGPGGLTTTGNPTDSTAAAADSGTGHVVANGHPSGAAPTAAAGANNGTSPPAPVISGNDSRGGVTFGSGTSPAAGAQAVVTFAAAYAAAPVVVLTPRNAATQPLGLYVSVTTTGFTISTVNAPTASQAATVYSVGFHVLG